MDITTTVRLPEDLHEKLREEAYKKKLSQNDIIIIALEGYLNFQHKLNQE